MYRKAYNDRGFETTCPDVRFPDLRIKNIFVVAFIVQMTFFTCATPFSLRSSPFLPRKTQRTDGQPKPCPYRPSYGH